VTVRDLVERLMAIEHQDWKVSISVYDATDEDIIDIQIEPDVQEVWLMGGREGE